MLALAALIALTSPIATEWVAVPPEPGFVAVYRRETAKEGIEESVPKGESFNQWTRMITRQRFNVPMTPRVFAGRMAAGMSGACPGIVISPLTAGPREAFVEQRFDCPRNPQTGKPETTFLRAYAGAGAVHAVQFAFRSVPSAAQADWARQRLAGTALCRGASSSGLCRNPPPTMPLG